MLSPRTLLVALVVLGSGADTHAGMPCQDYRAESYTHVAATLPLGGDGTRIVVRGGFGYVGLTTPSIEIVDLTNPLSPRHVGSFATAGPPTDIVIWDTLAFVTTGSSGLEIFDIGRSTDHGASTPTRIGGFDASSFASAVETDGSVAFLADHDGTITAVDVTSPSAPQLISRVTVGDGVNDLERYGEALVSIQSDRTLHVIDVATPSLPSIVGTMTFHPWQPRSLLVEESRAYVVCDVELSSTVLSLVDLSNPADPTPLDEIEIGLARSVSVWKDYVVVSGVGISFVDRSNPKQLRLAHRNGTFSANSSAIQGDLAFSAGGSDVVVSVITDPLRPEPVGGALTNLVTDFLALDDYLYVCGIGYGASSGLEIFDVSDPTKPKFISFATAGFPYCLDLDRSYAFVGAGIGLRVFDVSLPELPTPIASLDLAQRPERLRIRNQVAHITMVGRTFATVDVSNPSAPNQLAEIATPGNVNGLVLHGTYAMLADDAEGLVVIDVENPSAPSIAATSGSSPGARDVAIHSSYAYVGGSELLEVIDVSDPTDPKIVGSLPHDARRIAVHGDFLYSVNHNVVFSIARRDVPKRIGTFGVTIPSSSIGATGDFFVVGQGRCYHGGGCGGRFDIFPLACGSQRPAPPAASAPLFVPASFTLSPARPNPSARSVQVDLSLVHRSHVRVSIYDVQGRLVRSLLSRDLPQGLHTVTWDGCDQAGAVAGSGVYFVRGDAAEGVETRSVVLRR